MTETAVPSVSVAALPADAVLLDVREDDEWQAGHADGAVHIPLGDLAQRVDDVPVAAPLYVVCRAGGRSARAVAWLVGHGVEAVNVDGGMGAWMDAGRPMVSETGAVPFVR